MYVVKVAEMAGGGLSLCERVGPDIWQLSKPDDVTRA